MAPPMNQSGLHRVRLPVGQQIAEGALARIEPGLGDDLAHRAAGAHGDHRLAGRRDAGAQAGHGAVAAARDHRQAGRQPGGGRGLSGQPANHGRRRNQRRQLIGLHACQPQDPRIPRQRLQVEQPGGGSQAQIGRPDAGQRVQDPVFEPHPQVRPLHLLRLHPIPPAEALEMVGRMHRAARAPVERMGVGVGDEAAIHGGRPGVGPGHRIRRWACRPRPRPGTGCASRR